MGTPHIMSPTERREHLVHERAALKVVRRWARLGLGFDGRAHLQTARALDAAVLAAFARENTRWYDITRIRYRVGTVMA